MRVSLVTLFALACLSSFAQALTLSSSISDGKVSATLSDIDYPTTVLVKALNSGLPNNINVLVIVSDNDKALYLHSVNHQITYDLWDEVYQVTTVHSNGQSKRDAVASLPVLLQQLSRITIDNITNNAVLASQLHYQLSAQVVINPVHVDQIEKIQAWLSNQSNQVLSQPTTGHSNSAAGSGNLTISTIGVSSGPRFKKLFDKILEQQRQSNQTPALWRSKKVTTAINRAKLTQ